MTVNIRISTSLLDKNYLISQRSCLVILTDIVDFSLLVDTRKKDLMDDMRTLIKNHAAIIRLSAKGLSNLILQETGDGMLIVLCFSQNDPSLLRMSLDCIVALQEWMNQQQIQLRTGLHSGQCFMYQDINDTLNASGGTVCNTERIKTAANPCQVLISEEIHDIFNHYPDVLRHHRLMSEGPIQIYAKHGITLMTYVLRPYDNERLWWCSEHPVPQPILAPKAEIEMSRACLKRLVMKHGPIPCFVPMDEVENYLTLVNPFLFHDAKELLKIAYSIVYELEKEQHGSDIQYAGIEDLPEMVEIQGDIEVTVLKSDFQYLAHPWIGMLGKSLCNSSFGAQIANAAATQKEGKLIWIDSLSSNPMKEARTMLRCIPPRRLTVAFFKKTPGGNYVLIEAHHSLSTS